jgi:hypothetical protein
MPWIEIALPGSLLFTKFLLKLFVDRSATLPDMVSAILALPVDIVFLAASLLAGYTITTSANPKDGLLLFTGCICIALLIVVIWRRCEKQFSQDSYVSTALLGLINIALSGFTLVYSLNLLSVGGKQ